jgi:hypothetical protein
MKTRTPVEIDTRYSTTVDTMQEAFAFVMEHIDTMGPEPSVHINPCWGVDRDEAVNEPEGSVHFHVCVEGTTEMKNEENDA